MTEPKLVSAGDTVICATNETAKDRLTAGKTYVVEDITDGGENYTIIDDKDELESYNSKIFTHFTLSNSDEIPGFFEKESEESE